MTEVLDAKFEGLTKLVAQQHDEFTDFKDDTRFFRQELSTCVKELNASVQDLKTNLAALQTGHRTLIFVGTIVGAVAGWIVDKVRF